MRIAIVGAGLAGLSCAQALQAGGAEVELFDKGRGRRRSRRPTLPPTAGATPGPAKAGQDVLWDTELRLGACGDWLIGPRVESAWLSGRRLAQAVLEAT